MYRESRRESPGRLSSPVVKNPLSMDINIDIDNQERPVTTLLSNSTERIPDLENNVKEVKKIKDDGHKKEKLKLIKEYFIDYTANSNLHGLRYIGEKKRTPVEKIFWLFMFILCVVFCSFLIRKVWIKWTESPVIVSFAENSTPVWQIPYPAITVCFETKAMQTRFNFTKYYHMYLNETTKANLTEEEMHTFEDVAMVCDDHLAPETGRKFSPGNVTIDNIKRLSANLRELFFGCKWQGELLDNCEALFSPIITEEGLCYTFNTLGADQLFRTENLHTEYEYMESRNLTTTWTLEGGYPLSTPLKTYPHRGSGYGAKAGLVMLLTGKRIDMDYLCKGPVQGFKILLHNPAELPRLSQQYFRLPLSQEVVVAVKPNMMTTSEGLRPYDALRRQCYFPSERYLQYFKIYTQANCEMECLTNFTYTRCGCIHFGLPRGPDMKVCSAGSMKCIKDAQMELVTVEIQSGIDEKMSDNDTLREAREVAARCRCLPACTSIEYEAETSQADFDWKALYRAFNQKIDSDDMYFSRVMIFFKEAQFITSRRSELYGQTDFLANCGGLLGLFMGFSFLSVAEIIYFLTLRLCCLISKHRSARKKEFNETWPKLKNYE
ncbi:pickpocket protein 28-like [Epargyreus clarus]|uniref:pickpocket protein 28-like n=1 Tax=Epargyreus clarus TaxID=520877 RepID=UPI003C302929